uniref:Uncharacterized protein n=1 Tax=Catharus ustulatus TaxID=91951 RepID=A0A8C3TM67_CATUS
ACCWDHCSATSEQQTLLKKTPVSGTTHKQIPLKPRAPCEPLSPRAPSGPNSPLIPLMPGLPFSPVMPLKPSTPREPCRPLRKKGKRTIQIMGLGLAGPFSPKIPLLFFSKQEKAVLHG